MKIETRTKIVKYNVYIAKDGKEFTSPKDCKHYEMILDGTRMVCPECNGKERIAIEEEYNYHTGAPEISTIYPTCPKCNSKGYLEKKLKEVWE